MDETQQDSEAQGLGAAWQLLDAARGLKEKLVRETEPQLIKVALEIAEKIVGHQLDDNPEEIVQIVSNALETVRLQRQLIVRVHPDDLKHLQARRSDLLARLGPNQGIDLQGDPAILRGGCILETELANVDARLQDQVALLLGMETRKSSDDAPGVREPLVYIHKLVAQGVRAHGPRSKDSEIPGKDITPDNLRPSKGQALERGSRAGEDKNARARRPSLPEAESAASKLRVDIGKEAEASPHSSSEHQVLEALQLLAESRALKNKVIRQTTPQLKKLALKVAEKTLGHELGRDTDEMAHIISAALKAALQAPEIIVRVHLADLTNLQETKPELIAQLRSNEDIEVRDDSGIERGAFRIEAQIGTIHGQLEKQFEPLLQPLLGIHSGRT